ncbi:MAG: Exodeoxyribonuclease small subunit protein [Myxococcaceae bacterium]|nr:Exodeoxyribonuclease small subunit protein [Myxococcaceae bacterium]
MEKVVQAKREDASSPAFEDILSRLSTVVERLESGELPLEESLTLFEEGVRLSRSGSARLDEAERRIERLLHSDAPAHAGATEAIAELREPARVPPAGMQPPAGFQPPSGFDKENEVP